MLRAQRAPCRPWRGRPPRTARRVLRRARHPRAPARAARRRPRARGGRRRLGLRRLARPLFAEHVVIRSTRQELFFFDGGPAWRAPGVPAYVDFDRRSTAPATSTGSASRPRPTSTARRSTPTPSCRPRRREGEAIARRFLATRFPALADAPLTGSKTCRYELSPDSPHFIAAPHPEHPSVWLLGGGSGHGFKHGPAMAERVAPRWPAARRCPALGPRRARRRRAVPRARGRAPPLSLARHGPARNTPRGHVS